MTHSGTIAIDQVDRREVWRRFERGIVSNTLKAAESQLAERDLLSDPRLPQVFNVDRHTVDRWFREREIGAEQLMTLVVLFDIRLPPRNKQVAAGCVEAMSFVRRLSAAPEPSTDLTPHSLEYVASCFRDSDRIDRLLRGQDVPRDNEWLNDWGAPFLICCHVLSSAPGSERLAWLAAPSDSEWSSEKNSRRCDLIDKKIEGTISATESDELSRLQEELRRYVDRESPLPLEGARRIHEDLLAKKRGRGREGK